MTNFKVKSLEWFDIMSISDNYIYRHTNNDKGKYKINGNKLSIFWDTWGIETFIHKGNNEYYKENFKKFNINIETNTFFDTAELNIENKSINLKSMKKIGKYKFVEDILVVNWKDNTDEYFYMYDYGKLFSSMKIGSDDCRTKKSIKNIAIVFPQFHEIPENNKFWGKGFTEWTLLKKMPKNVSGQLIKRPHDDIGYYNLKEIL